MKVDVLKFDEYVKEVKWQWAKTYADTYPHYYTVREWRPDLDDVFVEVVLFIREYGITEWFFNTPRPYFYHDGCKYWTMGSPVDETVVINREKVSWGLDYDIHNRNGKQHIPLE